MVLGSNYGVLVTVVVATAALLICNAAAVTYTVGDNSGWLRPPGGEATYTAWAAQHNFIVGDVLVFRFSTGVHTAAMVTRDAFNSCSPSNPLSLQTTGPANFTLGATGPYYFICTIGSHCSSGQKLTLNVTAGSPNNSPSPRPSPTTPSGGVSPTSPPPPGSSSALRMARWSLSFFFISIAIALVGVF